MIRRPQVEPHQHEERREEALGLTERQMEEKTQRQRGASVVNVAAGYAGEDDLDVGVVSNRWTSRWGNGMVQPFDSRRTLILSIVSNLRPQ